MWGVSAYLACCQQRAYIARLFEISKPTAWGNSAYSVRHKIGCFNVTKGLPKNYNGLWESRVKLLIRPVESDLHGAAATIRHMLRVKLLEASARLPVVAHPGEDLGYDVFALEGVRLEPAQTVKVRTGIAVEARDPVTGAPLGCWCATAHRWRRGELPPRAA